MTVVTRDRNGLRLAVSPIRRVEVRDASATGDGSWTIAGYAAVFEQETVLYDGRWFRMREEVASDAFGPVLERLARGEELVHLNHGHNMETAIASTDVARSGGELPIGGLELAADEYGLRFFARVDPRDPDAQKLAVKLERRVVAQASFAFTIKREELVESFTGPDGIEDELWRIQEIGHLYDVCACAQGAYGQTESYLRSLATSSLGAPVDDVLESLRRSEASEGGQGRDAGDGDGPEADHPPEGGGRSASRELELVTLRAYSSTKLAATRSNGVRT